ncbi:hypothetical protein QQF64_007583 [Cirrhinus molitorella]|uniref:FACT complex subunit SSRP1 n=1 Tax=Cirrhinus molitorella TaxID=172907 RepID=A0ABR3MB00_9TELE
MLASSAVQHRTRRFDAGNRRKEQLDHCSYLCLFTSDIFTTGKHDYTFIKAFFTQKMGDTLEFNDIHTEVKGSWNDGRLRFSKQSVVYKSHKTGKVDSIPAPELSAAQWRRVCLGHGIKLATSSGHVYRYDGFKDTDFEKLSSFFKVNYKVELAEKDMCVKGWNWGTAKFTGSLLSFDVSDSPVFEIPLTSVSQCATGKNEVTVEFHQNDDAEVSLMEVRFYVPPNTGDDGSDPVEAFAQNVLSKADVIQATGDAVCIFKELQCLTPRGRYDIRIYPSFLHLHGKTFDYKIPYTTVLRLFLLPHKDQRQMFFVFGRCFTFMGQNASGVPCNRSETTHFRQSRSDVCGEDPAGDCMFTYAQANRTKGENAPGSETNTQV